MYTQSNKKTTAGDMYKADYDALETVKDAGGITEYAAKKAEVKLATLTSGSTSVTFTELPTTGNYTIDFSASNGANYTAINTATAGQVTLTYDAQSADIVVKCRIMED